MKLVFLKIFLLLYFEAMKVQTQQVNLGSLSLTRNHNGDLLFGLGQGANIFGFGADRRLGLNIGPGRFGAINDNGLILGNQRFGIDSQLGYENGLVPANWSTICLPSKSNSFPKNEFSPRRSKSGECLIRRRC
uniref:Uncharacterized protein n=1 Tax=Meloidogyne javanica TaxID=6303 RepID=A0A915N0X6_MELJA